ncbi:MAG: TIGR00725 family protein [Planctomycetota bacterium]|nr:TIGR00725 family protein [Planctomycetota bacterium]
MRTRLVAVVGGGTKLSPDQETTAEELGAGLVGAGYGVVCGGLGGVMEAVARGAARARGEAPWPPVVGILPNYDPAAGNDHLDIVLPTGMGHARNVLVAAAGEAVICVGGAMGAMSEMAIARKIGRPVVTLPGSGGAARVLSKAVQTVISAENAADAVAKVKELLS